MQLKSISHKILNDMIHFKGQHECYRKFYHSIVIMFWKFGFFLDIPHRILFLSLRHFISINLSFSNFSLYWYNCLNLIISIWAFIFFIFLTFHISLIFFKFLPQFDHISDTSCLLSVSWSFSIFSCLCIDLSKNWTQNVFHWEKNLKSILNTAHIDCYWQRYLQSSTKLDTRLILLFKIFFSDMECWEIHYFETWTFPVYKWQQNYVIWTLKIMWFEL